MNFQNRPRSDQNAVSHALGFAAEGRGNGRTATARGDEGAGGQRARRRQDQIRRHRRRQILHRGRRPRRSRRHAQRDCKPVLDRPAAAFLEAVAAAAAWRARQWSPCGRWCRVGQRGLAGRHHPQRAHRTAAGIGRLDQRGQCDAGRSADRHAHRDRIRFGITGRSLPALFGPRRASDGDRWQIL